MYVNEYISYVFFDEGTFTPKVHEGSCTHPVKVASVNGTSVIKQLLLEE
jgi:hypothetical protein